MEYVFNHQFTKEMLSAFYKESGQMVLPEPTDNPLDDVEKRKALAVQSAVNFASLGYKLDHEAVLSLSRASSEQILEFYDTYMKVLEEQVGTRFKDAHLFYPDFPEQVIGKDRIEILFDQIIYALSGFEYTPAGENSTERYTKEHIVRDMPFLGEGKARPLKVIPVFDKETQRPVKSASLMIDEYIDMTVQSLKPYTAGQIELIKQVLTEGATKEFKQNLKKPKGLPNHENRAILAYLAYEASGTAEIAKTVLTEAKDVLRFASLTSHKPDNEDIVLYVNSVNSKTATFKLSRKERKVVLSALESIAKTKNLTIETWADKETWKKFYKQVHIGEFQKQFPNTFKSAQELRENLTPQRYETILEKSLLEEDLEKSIKLLSSRPGLLMRRADHLLRIADKEPDVQKRSQKVEMVVSAIEKAAPHAGISALADMANAVKQRDKDEERRTVTYNMNGNNVVMDISDKCRSAFSEQTVERLKTMNENIFSPKGLSLRFAGKEDLGKVYISPEMEYYTVPMRTRQISPGIETFGSGSAIKVDDKETQNERMFVHWTNLENEYDSVDIDLSAHIIYPNESKMVSWDNEYSIEGVTHSGDIRDGGSPNGPGAAEYIDMDIQKLKASGAKYVVVNVNSFTDEKFSEQPNTYFGWMDRSNDDFGTVFEPATVSARYKLLGNTTGVVAALYDVQQNRMLWIDQPLNGRVASLELDNIHALIDKTLGQAFTISDLAKANAIANDGYTQNPDMMKDADTLFMTKEELAQAKELYPDVDFDSKKVVLPSDLSYLTSVLLADGPEIGKPKERDLDLDKDINSFVPEEKQKKAHHNNHHHDDMLQ